MDELFVVRGAQTVRDLEGVVERLAQGNRRLEPLPQRCSLEQLRDDVSLIVMTADVVNREDVRMIERGDRPRLLLESLQPVTVGREAGRQDFDCHVAAEARVEGPVHLAHAPGAQRGLDLVGTESAA